MERQSLREKYIYSERERERERERYILRERLNHIYICIYREGGFYRERERVEKEREKERNRQRHN